MRKGTRVECSLLLAERLLDIRGYSSGESGVLPGLSGGDGRAKVYGSACEVGRNDETQRVSRVAGQGSQ